MTKNRPVAYPTWHSHSKSALCPGQNSRVCSSNLPGLDREAMAPRAKRSRKPTDHYQPPAAPKEQAPAAKRPKPTTEQPACLSSSKADDAAQPLSSEILPFMAQTPPVHKRTTNGRARQLSLPSHLVVLQFSNPQPKEGLQS